MKKIYAMGSIILAVWLFVGCKSTHPTAPLASPLEQAGISEMKYTKEDVIGNFKNSNYSKGCTVTDCALSNDFAYDLIGIVQYTDEQGNACNLAFISKNNTRAPIGLDAEGRMTISSDSMLTYLGNGTVKLSLTEIETRKTYDYLVEYSYLKEATNFVITSSERASAGAEQDAAAHS